MKTNAYIIPELDEAKPSSQGGPLPGVKPVPDPGPTWIKSAGGLLPVIGPDPIPL